MILLDTNIVIAFFNGNNLVNRKIQERIERIAFFYFTIFGGVFDLISESSFLKF